MNRSYPAKPSLEIAALKVQRAAKHLDSLQSQVLEFLQVHPYRVVESEFDQRREAHDLFIAHDGTPLPTEWAAIIGEIAHDLRSALDNMVCQLSRNNCATCDCERTGFPLFLNGPNSKQRERFRFNSRLIEDLSRAQQTRIERLQPYKRGNGHRWSPLWHLHQLNNMDKHRVGLAVAGFGEWLLIKFNDGAEIRGKSSLKARMYLCDGAKVGYVGAHVNVEFFVVPNVVFDDTYPSLRLLPVFPTIVDIGERVAAILNEFAPDFR